MLPVAISESLCYISWDYSVEDACLIFMKKIIYFLIQTTRCYKNLMLFSYQLAQRNMIPFHILKLDILRLKLHDKQVDYPAL